MNQPFPGLRPYLESETEIFFGQDIALQSLLKRLNSQRLVTLLGLSGCGKSSLLNAGLLANLRPRVLSGVNKKRWLIAVLKPGNDPLGSLEAELQKIFPRLPVRAEIENDTSGLARLVKSAELDSRQRVLIVVDQFEELFRYRRAASARDGEVNSAEREDKAAYFIKLLLQAQHDPTSQVYILLAMRSEFLGDCATFYGLAEQVNGGTFLLPRMTRDQMEETVVGPLDDLNIEIEQDLVQLLLNETEEQDDGLPLLQHALRRTWERWQRRKRLGTALGMEDFKAIDSSAAPGDSYVKQHLNDHLNSIYDSLTGSQKFVAERLFRLLSERDSNGRMIRRPLPYEQLVAEAGSEVTPVIEAFRDARRGRTFLMPPASAPLEGATVDISHECLLRRWNRLEEWVETEERDARVFILIAEAADDAGRRKPAGAKPTPLAGATLEAHQAWWTEALPTAEWARRYEGPFDATLQRRRREFAAAMEYLDWSIAAHEAEKARASQMKLDLERSKREQAESELRIATLEAKKRKLRFQVIVIVGVSVMLLIGLIAVSAQARQRALLQAGSKGYQSVIDTSKEIQDYAQTALKQLDDGKLDPDRTREVLQGVIDLSGRVKDQSVTSDNILKGNTAAIAPVNVDQEGWLYLGVLDRTGHNWAASAVRDKLMFIPDLSKDMPIVQQLQPNRVRVKTRDFINLHDPDEPSRMLKKICV